MPQVKGGQKGKSGGKQGAGSASKAPARKAVIKQTTDASSVILGIFFLIALVVGTAAWMGQSMSVVSSTVNNLTDGVVKSSGLSVKDIYVYNAAPEQEMRIRNAMGVEEGDSMFRSDPREIKARIERVKGLGDIQVHRYWPDQIAVFVTPLEAAMLYWDGERYIPMDPAGGEVPDVDPETVDFPVITGKGSIDAAHDLIADLQSFPAILTRLAYAERIGERRWDLVMTSGVRVKLPQSDAVYIRKSQSLALVAEDEDTPQNARFEALETLLALQRDTEALDRQLTQIDLRDPDYVYVRRSQLTAALEHTDDRG